MERAEGRMPEASVRRHGTGNPGPPECLRVIGDAYEFRLASLGPRRRSGVNPASR